LLWQAQDGLSLYGNYAENFGANTGRDFAGEPLKPESATQYEVGAKAELLGGKLTTSLALFHLTKQNVATADPLNPGFNIAIGEVRSQGVEFDIQGELASGWNAIATYTYTDAVITKSNNGDEGLRKSNVPRNMASISTTYKLPQASLQGWKIGGGIFWRDESPDATNTLDSPARTVVDAMASYEFKTGKYKTTLQLNIDNVFNRIYYADALFYANAAQFRASTPRTATASVRLDF
jgi:iron complex outermembrane receptor protein